MFFFFFYGTNRGVKVHISQVYLSLSYGIMIRASIDYHRGLLTRISVDEK